MAIFIDSANLSDINAASSLGWVHGITTNPILLAQSGMEPVQQLQDLNRSGFMQIFYQLTSDNLTDMYAEAEQAMHILEIKLVLKLPPTELGFRFCSEYRDGPCCPTAIFSPAQALAARDAGARYVAVYVNRASRLLGDGIRLVEEIAEVLDGSTTEILAASLKSSDEAVAAHNAGAQHLTMPLDVLRSLPENEHSQAALKSFQNEGIGI